jgi:hypothetical protein
VNDQGQAKTLEIYICGVGVIVQDKYCHLTSYNTHSFSDALKMFEGVALPKMKPSAILYCSGGKTVRPEGIIC